MRIAVGRALAVAGVIAWSSPVAAATDTCAGSSTWTHCSVANTGTQVDVGGSTNQPGSTSPGSGGGGNNGSGPGDSGPRTRPGQDGATPAEECPEIGCRGNYTVVTVPDVTLADLASFVPAAPSFTGEPEGYGITGSPTNLLAEASTHLLSGQILGWDVTVRFTPATFEMEYGDGTTGRTSTGGARWADLGLPPFSPTATSHVYSARGTYTASLTLGYTAAVNFGGGWREVDGLVRSPAVPYSVQILDARTALVDLTCAENPGGPGC